jgi:hypothetical protein
LFVSASTRTKFKQDPVRFTRTRHVMRLEKDGDTRIE